MAEHTNSMHACTYRSPRGDFKTIRSSGSEPAALPTARVERGVLSQATGLVLSGARGVPATAVGVARAVQDGSKHMDNTRTRRHTRSWDRPTATYVGQLPRASWSAVERRRVGEQQGHGHCGHGYPIWKASQLSHSCPKPDRALCVPFRNRSAKLWGRKAWCQRSGQAMLYNAKMRPPPKSQVQHEKCPTLGEATMAGGCMLGVPASDELLDSGYRTQRLVKTASLTWNLVGIGPQPRAS
jgi:hypothetical protein